MKSYFDVDLDNTNKMLIKDLLPKVIYINEQIFDLQIDQIHIDKLMSYWEKLPLSIVDFKNFIDNFYKKVDEYLIDSEVVSERLK